MTKIKTLLLRHGVSPDKDSYLVEKITDDISYNPGQYIHRREVDCLCRSGTWKVTIIGRERRESAA